MEVYCVTGPAGKKYIGIVYGRKQTVAGRWCEHCSPRAATKHLRLERAIRKYGPAAFRIQTIDSARTIEELRRKESYYILLFGTHRSGYNGTTGDSFAAAQQALHLSRQRPEYRQRRREIALGNNAMRRPEVKALARNRRVDRQEAERRARIDQLFMERWANLRWL